MHLEFEKPIEELEHKIEEMKHLAHDSGVEVDEAVKALEIKLEGLKKMIPTDQLWPMGESWNYHCGRYEFADLSRFNAAINARYGAPANLEEFDVKAQAMNYELIRPMFEAFQVNKKHATGVIQWMLNAAWPKMYWQLYDYYLMPNGAFYGTQKACQPLNLIYNYGDNQVYFVNDHLHAVDNLQARIRIYDIQSNSHKWHSSPRFYFRKYLSYH